jgi:2-amino-4-hydroxy-6-hydroxymethyldihydropteridine diphosphokinase
MICYLGLGANIGNREENIKNAISRLSSDPEILIKKRSSMIETKPYGNIDQPDFINSVIEIDTDITAENLLSKCLTVENELGRKRNEKWDPRTIDIDVLFYGKTIVNLEQLTIPHPDLHNRKFVLRSLNEICPDFVHPVLNKNIKELYLEIK